MSKILLLVLIVLMLSSSVTAYSEDFSADPCPLTGFSLVNSWTCTLGQAVSSVTGTTNSAEKVISVSNPNYVSIDMKIAGDTGNGNDNIKFYFEKNATDGNAIRMYETGGASNSALVIDGASGYAVQGITSGLLYTITVETIGTNYNVSLYTGGTLVNNQLVAITTNIVSPDRIKLEVTNAAGGPIIGTFDNIIVSENNPDLAGSGTITFDQNSYDLGDIAYIDATLINPDYNTYNYRTVIIDPLDNIINAHTWDSGSLTETNFPLNINMQGTYTVKLQRYTSAISYDYLSTDTAYAGYINNQSLSTTFDEYYYNTGDTVIINSNISNIDNSNYFYDVMILKPNGNFYNVHNITANESYSFVTNVPGEWNTILTAYPKSEPSIIENQATDSMFTYGTVQGASWVSFNDTYYNKNSWARIDYGISVNDFYDSHKMQITNQEGTVVFDRQIISQSGYFDYYFYESGKYTVTIDRNWFALDWDLTDNEILATDVTEVTNTIEGGFTLGVNPTILNCGQTVYLSADTPNVWNTTNFTIKDVNGTVIKTILGQAGSWKTNQTGQFWVYLNDAGAVQDSGYFYVYGTCTGFDVMNPDGSGGIKPKPYPQTDQATSNAALQNNLLYFMGLPIFWGMILFCGILITAATLKAGKTIPYLAPVIIMFELVIGLLEPYSSYIAVGMAIVLIMYFIANFAVGYNQGSS